MTCVCFNDCFIALASEVLMKVFSYPLEVTKHTRIRLSLQTILSFTPFLLPDQARMLRWLRFIFLSTIGEALFSSLTQNCVWRPVKIRTYFHWFPRAFSTIFHAVCHTFFKERLSKISGHVAATYGVAIMGYTSWSSPKRRRTRSRARYSYRRRDTEARRTRTQHPVSS